MHLWDFSLNSSSSGKPSEFPRWNQICLFQAFVTTWPFLSEHSMTCTFFFSFLDACDFAPRLEPLRARIMFLITAVSPCPSPEAHFQKSWIQEWAKGSLPTYWETKWLNPESRKEQLAVLCHTLPSLFQVRKKPNSSTLKRQLGSNTMDSC